MEALPLRPVALSAAHERLDHVVDVDRVQPDLVAADGPEPVPEDGLEQRKKVIVAWPIYQAGPGDDRWKATAPRLTDRPLGFRLRLLIDVGRADRRVLVRRLVPRHPKDPSGAAVNEPPRRGPVLAAGEEKPRSLHMRPLVLRCWNARYEQPARQVVDDIHTLHRRPDRGPVGDVADSDLGTRIGQRFRRYRRPGEHPHPRTVEQQPAHQAGAQEARPASDEDGRLPYGRGLGLVGPGHADSSRAAARCGRGAVRERA